MISAGKHGKFNGDNLDIYVTTNDIRMNNKNRDYHFFASDWTADRADLSGLGDKKPLIEDELISMKLYTLNDEETKFIRQQSSSCWAELQLSTWMVLTGWILLFQNTSHIHWKKP